MNQIGNQISNHTLKASKQQAEIDAERQKEATDTMVERITTAVNTAVEKAVGHGINKVCQKIDTLVSQEKDLRETNAVLKAELEGLRREKGQVDTELADANRQIGTL